MDDPLLNLPQENAQVEKTTSSQVLIIRRTVLNSVVVAVIFFVLGAISISLLNTQSATAHLTEHQELIDQAVAAALDARGSAAANPGPNLGDRNTRLEVSTDDDPSHGPAEASVIMVEFSDFNCPYCGRFARDTLPLLRENYGDLIRFVYRDFAILGPTSLDAAVAGECANDQGSFWEYHDLLFANQGNFSEEALISYAEQVGLNAEQFTVCLSDSTVRDEVIADTGDAQRLGATGTPTFFINGRPVVGAQPFEVFASIIDEELNVASNPDSG